jgi:hypothetical protein
MDPFEEFESENKSKNDFDNDPAADFLAREQAELAKIENNDANDFFGSSSNDFGGSNANTFNDQEFVNKESIGASDANENANSVK